MHFRLASCAVLLTIGGVLAAASVSTTQPLQTSLVVHEWGTFTSIAGADGAAVQWLPHGGRSDLPCFVERGVFKGSLSGTVRMETPVLYFYSPEEVAVSVGVSFKNGILTEWYPHAVRRADSWNYGDSEISWRNVQVSPAFSSEFPVEPGQSHYYEARRTDAVPLQVGSQRERFLFYRGVGRFAAPVSATVGDDGRTTVWSPAGQPLGDLIVFDNHAGTIAYAAQPAVSSRVTLDRPVVDDDTTALRRELERILVANGLYEKEAAAMVATWNDSWFEEGSRLFYIAPRQAVDAILPLQIAPAPSEIARVFVGRLELATTATRDELRRALETDDRAALDRFGRFLQPIGARVVAESEPSERPLLEGRLSAASSSWVDPSYACR
jgi:hypothetical protein